MSAPSTTQKLTKKQKKSLAFRDRKSGKKDSSKTASFSNNDGLEMEDNAIPAMEDQDLLDVEGNGVEGEAGSGQSEKRDKGKGKDKAGVRPQKDGEPVPVGSGKEKKRKREVDDDGANDKDEVDTVDQASKPKKKKASKKAKVDSKTEEGDDEKAEEGEKGKAQRFILFVGNLSYTTSKEAILAHFSSVCDPAPTVRLLTPKARPGVPVRGKSKGCAFLEFKTKVPLQAALKLHQSMLEGRMINVELTAGGGGKSDARLNKVRERNKELMTQRQKRVDKDGKKSSSIPSNLDRPQRFSATSGLVQQPLKARTWSVGDTVEEKTHRGGKRKQRGNRTAKSQGTGVNAIPVG